MVREWIIGREGKNLKFKREALLNYGMNRWGLNKAHSVGTTSELIRISSPSTFEEWENYYFENAKQKKRNGIRITREYLIELGRKLYIKLSEVVQNELESVTEEECIDYAYNLVLNRTYEGYMGEIQTTYGQLQNILGVQIKPAPDEWDRLYNVDFFIEINGKYIGLQIKPTTFKHTFEDYKWKEMQETSHRKFQEKFGGRVFIVFSVREGKKKVIHNLEVIEEIRKEIERLEKE
ncbi:MAG: MjaI family restriction endonuclease [Euryarchaeota archaeon]|nr:MjaI family restriction endonuclease [Euryarchaeota archaeon]